jgi:hypothetical protein
LQISLNVLNLAAHLNEQMENKLIISSVADGEQLLEHTITTALEGGSNYWYWLKIEERWFDLAKRYDIVLSKKETPVRTVALPLTERICNALINIEDFSISIYDLEDTEQVLGELNLQNFIDACEICKKDYPRTWDNFMNEAWDAIDADILFQLTVMGEVVYG